MQGQECYRGATPGRPFTIGNSPLDNDGRSPVRIRSITLKYPHGLKLVGLFLTPKRDGPGVGAWNVYPPPQNDPDAAALWRNRIAVEGAIIDPGHQADILAGVSLTGAGDGTAEGFHVVYSADGRNFFYDTRIRFLYGSRRGSCDFKQEQPAG